MTLGQKIKKLRIENNLTQKDLADRLYVTFQTVSKWENDENEPDVATLRELAKLFDCSLDYLLSEDDKVIEVEPEPELVAAPSAVEPVKEIRETIVIHQKELHVCERCKKDIPEDELEMEEICTSPYHRGHPATYRNAYYHRSCLKELHEEQAEADKRAKIAHASRAKKLSFGWGIAGGVVALAICLGVFIGVEACRNALGIVGSIFLSIGISYLVFADLYCIISGSYVGEIFEAVAGWSIKMPGVIFSWDIEGIAWAIAMKIGLAILGFMLGVAVLGLAIAISGFFAAISFPFILIHNIGNNYADAI